MQHSEAVGEEEIPGLVISRLSLTTSSKGLTTPLVLIGVAGEATGHSISVTQREEDLSLVSTIFLMTTIQWMMDLETCLAVSILSLLHFPMTLMMDFRQSPLTATVTATALRTQVRSWQFSIILSTRTAVSYYKTNNHYQPFIVWGHPFMMSTRRGERVRLRWTHVDGGPAPCGRPHRKLKLESNDVILSSSLAKKLASFFTRISSFDRTKVESFLRCKFVI